MNETTSALAAIGEQLAETRQAVTDLRATLTGELDRALGSLAALRNSILALELAAGDDRSTEVRALLDQVTLLQRERDRQARQIESLRGSVRGLSRKLERGSRA